MRQNKSFLIKFVKLTSQVTMAKLQYELGCQPSINIYFLTEHWKHDSMVSYNRHLWTKHRDFFDTLCFFDNSLIQQPKQLTNTLFLIGLEDIKVETIFAWCKLNRMTYMKEIHRCSLCSNKQLVLLQR